MKERLVIKDIKEKNPENIKIRKIHETKERRKSHKDMDRIGLTTSQETEEREAHTHKQVK